MSILIEWSPSDAVDIASYDLERTDNLTGALWVLLANIPHNLSGPNFDPDTGKFFFSDSTGDSTKFYRLTSIDLGGNRSAPSTPFQPMTVGPAIPNNVRVDHNYPTPANLRYQTTGGSPIEEAIIRVFQKADFDLGLTGEALATTRTNVRGEWVDPVFLAAGFTYVVQFAREGLYGPDHREITV